MQRAAEDVVGFDREDFAQAYGRTVTEERPDFHFADALTAVLRLAAERLLGREPVGPDRAHVDLVFHHVVEFEHVHDADGDRLRERFAGAAVEENALAVFLDFGLGGSEFDQRLRMKADAGVAARCHAQRKRDQFLGFLVKRAIFGRGAGQVAESLHHVGNIAAQRRQILRDSLRQLDIAG